VDRAVGRLVEHASDLRERDLLALDTFALPEIIRAMSSSHDGVTLERLTRLARHATGRGQELDSGASAANVRRAVADWREWWFVHATDFVALEGGERAIAFVTQTRYGKWLDRARSGELGVSVIDREPIADKLRARAPVTLLICGLAMLASWSIAVPLGAIGAWRHGRTFDVASTAVLFALYATEGWRTDLGWAWPWPRWQSDRWRLFRVGNGRRCWKSSGKTTCGRRTRRGCRAGGLRSYMRCATP
jgi:hypothetical protein